MKLFPGLLFCSLVLGVSGQWYSFVGEAAQGKAAGLGGIQGPLGLALSTFKGRSRCLGCVALCGRTGPVLGAPHQTDWKAQNGSPSVTRERAMIIPS